MRLSAYYSPEGKRLTVCVDSIQRLKLRADGKVEMWSVQMNDAGGCFARCFVRTRDKDGKWPSVAEPLPDPPAWLKVNRVYEISLVAGSINNQDDPSEPAQTHCRLDWRSLCV